MSRSTTSTRPVLVVPHGHRSIPVLQLAAAAEPLCDLVWLVRSDEPGVGSTRRLLSRLGDVIDVAGLSADAVARAVARYRPTGVVGFRDEDLMPLATLAERLDLPFHRPTVAEGLADKAAQRRALRAARLDVPRLWAVPARRTGSAVADLVRRAHFPAVLKPRRGSGSRHTFRVAEPTDLVAVLAWLDREPDGAEEMVLEEYLPSRADVASRRFADYVSVETMVVEGRIHHLALTGRLHPAPSFRETGFFLPSDLATDEREAALAVATSALEALDVRTGCLHTEVKLTPDGPRVIEVNGRMGGGVADLVAAASGVDLLHLVLRLALGQSVEVDGLVACRRIGFRLFLQPPPSACAVRAIDGLGALRRLPGVADVAVHVPPGEAVDPLQGTRAFVLAVSGAARHHAEVAAVERRMYDVAGVVYEHAPDRTADLPLGPPEAVA